MGEWCERGLWRRVWETIKNELEGIKVGFGGLCLVGTICVKVRREQDQLLLHCSKACML